MASKPNEQATTSIQLAQIYLNTYYRRSFLKKQRKMERTNDAITFF